MTDAITLPCGVKITVTTAKGKETRIWWEHKPPYNQQELHEIDTLGMRWLLAIVSNVQGSVHG